MHSQTITIVNKLGLHARAAAKLTELASQFQSHITLSKGHLRVNAKSIMGVMLLAAGKGMDIQVHAEGEDAEQAMQAVVALVASGFGESE